jgi:hypothetical protein
MQNPTGPRKPAGFWCSDANAVMTVSPYEARDVIDVDELDANQ